MAENPPTSFRNLLDQGQGSSLTAICQTLHPADIADRMEGLTVGESLDLLDQLGHPKAIGVFESLPIEHQQQMAEEANRARIAPLVNEMAPDDRADLVARLSPEIVESLMPLLAAAERQDIKKLLQYEDNTAGSVMTTEYVALSQDMTADAALAAVRRQAPAHTTIYCLYAVDASRRLAGVLSLRDLIMAKPSALIRDIMKPHVISVPLNEDREQVAAKISHYNFLAMPVVDAEGRLAGIVTVDDAMDVVNEEMTEDVYALGAAGKPPEEHYLNAGVFALARQRIVWLMLLVFTGILSGMVLQSFHTTIEKMVALMFFVPLLCGSGGNAGSQSSTTIVRALATGELHMGDALRALRKELLVGLIVGVALAVLAAGRALLLRHTGENITLNAELHLALAVGLAMLATIVVAKVLGAALPILFKRIGLDPAIMSAPFIASILDILSVFVYLNLARWLVIPQLE